MINRRLFMRSVVAAIAGIPLGAAAIASEPEYISIPFQCLPVNMVIRNPRYKSDLVAVSWIVTIKTAMGQEHRTYRFGDPKFIGKQYALSTDVRGI